ncbi:MAG: CaiB/BaiF CoA-transferase family protein [Acidobacteriota bacterium]
MPAQASGRPRRAAGGALAGIRVVDLTRAMAGPYCTMILGDLGAEILKIEEPTKGDETRAWGPPFVKDESAYFLSANRNKKSVTLNLKHDEGRRLLGRLLELSDVLVENFRPGTLARLGFDPARLGRRCPRLIVCSISGYGADGPDRERPGYDLILQGEGGLMSLTGQRSGPPSKVGVAVADIGAGMFAAVGILAALAARERTGRGQRVETSLLEGQVAWLTYMAGNYFATGRNPERPGNAHPSIVPYQSFETRDIPLTVAVNNEKLWSGFCEALKLRHLRDDPRFATNPQRVRNREALVRELEAKFRDSSGRRILRRLRRAGIPCGPIRSVAEVCEDPQVRHRRMVERVRHPTAGAIQLLGSPVKLSATPGPALRPPPTLGQHTEEVLKRLLGLRTKQIQALRAAGAIR